MVSSHSSKHASRVLGPVRCWICEWILASEPNPKPWLIKQGLGLGALPALPPDMSEVWRKGNYVDEYALKL